MNYPKRQVSSRGLFTDDTTGAVKGIRDANDGDEHTFVYEGEPTNSVAFSTTPDTTRPLSIGELRWNVTDGTLECVLKGGNVTLQLGQENVVRFRNTSASDIDDGVAVYVTGSNGNFLTAEPARAHLDSTSEMTIGVTTEPIAKNTEGFVTVFGLVRNINTAGLTEGAAVWLSSTTAGVLTSTRPGAPAHAVMVGYCLRSHPTLGVIFVHAQDGYELGELHDVKITDPTDGQYLRYQSSTGLWINSA